MKPIKTILVATDFSAGSRSALDWAAVIAREQKAKLLLLHVVPRLQPKEAIPLLEEGYRFDLQRYQHEARAKLSELQVSKVVVEHVLKEGEVAGTICRVADETPCDLVVLSAHGHGNDGRVLMGDVAEVVMRAATCPVIMVKTPNPEA